jgi:archaellum component FlaF (FlaF/FlaG flagellin family)
MENLFITIVCIALILLATVSYATSSLDSADMISNSFKMMLEKAGEISRTEITATAAATAASGSEVEVTLSNDGNTALRNFRRWDVIVRYQGGTTVWVPYSASATPGWSDNGTFLNGGADIFEPGILNPAETLKIKMRLSPAVAENTTNLAVISTDNGVKTQRSFGW